MDDRFTGRDTASRGSAAGDPRLDALRRLAALLDDAIEIPGTRFRIGLDPLIGLVPGIGDLAGGLLGAYVLLAAWRLGAPTSVLLRLVANLGIDVVVGIVPLAGDVADAAWKANTRNVRVLERWIASPGRTERASFALVAGLAIGVLGVGAALAWAAWRLFAWAYGVVQA
jgi:Domain of unknown function (DUF4112)